MQNLCLSTPKKLRVSKTKKKKKNLFSDLAFFRVDYFSENNILHSLLYHSKYFEHVRKSLLYNIGRVPLAAYGSKY
jgi:hypothetical protein